MRFVLMPLRVVALLAHIVVGLFMVGVVFPTVRQATRNRINRQWSRGVVVLCGARLIVSGAPLSQSLRETGIEAGSIGRLALANHVSWIDVFAINAALPCRFVAKDEIGHWPLLGTLVTRAGTLYIERGRRHAVAAMNHKVRDHLQAGETIVVFAEGTTTDGSRLLPFHSNLVAPAISAEAPVLPICVRYFSNGAPTDAAAFTGDTSLLSSIGRIFVARKLTIEVGILPEIATEAESNRHAIARTARSSIAHALGLAPDESAERESLAA
jgi:1-acyl-sn-glycerol-3-phosphate acyltransferase